MKRHETPALTLQWFKSTISVSLMQFAPRVYEGQSNPIEQCISFVHLISLDCEWGTARDWYFVCFDAGLPYLLVLYSDDTQTT